MGLFTVWLGAHRLRVKKLPVLVWLLEGIWILPSQCVAKTSGPAFKRTGCALGTRPDQHAGVMANLAVVVEWLWEVSPVLKCWHESSKSSILWHLAKYQEKPRLRVLGAQEGTHGKNIGNSSLEKWLHVKKCPFRRETCNNSHCLFKILTSGLNSYLKWNTMYHPLGRFKCDE